MMTKRTDSTTQKEIGMLTVERTGRFNNKGESKFHEYRGTNGELFRWFEKSVDVYLFTRNMKLIRMGNAHTREQFIAIITNYYTKKEMKKKQNRQNLSHHK